MDIQVSGRKMNVGEALTDHIKERLGDLADKYFQRAIDSNVTMSKEGHLYHADCTLHANAGVSLQSHGSGDEPYGAFEDAAVKVEKQLRRYKRRVTNHHRQSVEDLEL